MLASSAGGRAELIAVSHDQSPPPSRSRGVRQLALSRKIFTENADAHV
jgi:hypothetical protein